MGNPNRVISMQQAFEKTQENGHNDLSEAVLAGGAVADEDNLYAARWEGGKWVPSFIATLSHQDERDWGSFGTGNAEIDRMTARVSPDGRYLAFMSDRSLTGYDNRDALSGQLQ